MYRKGSIILIGATTENPSFEVNSALLSRCKVFVLKPLEQGDLVKLIQNVISNSQALIIKKSKLKKIKINTIANFADGDARKALNILEMAVLNGKNKVRLLQ